MIEMMLDKNFQLGELQSVHGVSRFYKQRVIVYLICCFVALGFAIYLSSIYQGNSHSLLGVILIYVFFCAAPILWGVRVVWQWFRVQNSEVKVFQEGLVYTVGNRTQGCKWNEILSFSVRAEQILVGKQEVVFVIEKTSGEKITLTKMISGVELLSGLMVKLQS